MALVTSSSLSSTLPTWIQCRNPRAAFTSRSNSKPRNQKAQSTDKNNRFRHLFEVVRKDAQYLKKKVDVGIEWANVAFQIPKVSKTLDDLVWLRNLERHDSDSVDPPRVLSQPLYPELTGVDLLMADLKALEAYISYVYYLSKGFSRPLPQLYDPQDIAHYFNYRPHIVAIRLIEVFFSFTSAAIKIRTSKFNNINEDINSSDYFFGMMLKETMLSLGPVFIKVGQSLSTRPDIIGTEMSKALSELHDQIPPFPRTEAMTIIEEELGSPVESFFTYISEEPVAAASFGQVYRGATLDGFSVAVKVQRPNLRHVVVRDVHILRLGLGLFQRIAKRRSDLRLYADELGKGFLGELDYNLEAANASEFMEAHSHFSFMCVPNIYPQLTRKRVLTMEWIDGESPNELLNVSSGNLMHGSKYSERQQYEARRRLLDLVNKGVEACLVQLLETGILHADPHPGNLRYTSSGQMGFLDFGLICRMEKKHQFAMLASIVHIVNGDWASLVQALTEMDVVGPGDNIRRITMDLDDALGEVQYKDGTPDVKFSRVLGKIWSVAFKYHLRMPPYYTLVLRSLASFEGLAVATDPNFKTFEAAFPYVAQKLLTDSSAGARKLLHSVVLNKRKEFQWEKLGLFLRLGATRKSYFVLASNSEISPNNSTNEEAKRVFNVANLVLKLLPSKDGAALRRLLMTVDGASLIRAMISKQGLRYRQQFSRDMSRVLHQWTSQALGLDIVKTKKINDYETIFKDRRLKVIFNKVLESARRDRVLMVKLCWASFVMFVTASALACHRVLVSLSDIYITSFSFAPKRFAITT